MMVDSSLKKQIANEMYETYKELYNVISLNFDTEKLSRFFPMNGSSFNGNIKLMIIGRSVNGWTELDENSDDEFAAHAIDAVKNNGFFWLRDDGKGTKTYPRESDGKECRYNINRSSFFRTTRKILNVMKPETVKEDRWFEHIVWSNLYPIAPLHSGNAEGKLQNCQRELGKKLLVQQIEFYNPTHILFITDWEWWFDKFTDVFPDVKKVGNSVTNNIVGKGVFNNAKVLVTVRPDRTRPNRPNEEQFVNDVVKVFSDL